MNVTTVDAVVAVVVIGAVIAIARFEVFCLRELANATDAELQYLTRPAWVAVIVLMIPLGGVAFLYCGTAR